MEIDWNGIVREHGRTVFGAAWRILGHAADAEDVVQEVFLEAQQLENSRPVDQWQSLLRRMATFRALDKLRRRKHSAPLDGLSVTAKEHAPEAIAVANELETRLRQAIAQLPSREAAVFCLRYFEESRYDEIARSLQISPAAAATALHKAREKLKTLLADFDGEN
ncbi:MAG: sigma-70 family RNA polymerase sigma factor [Planctomycetaceae bacterium]